MTDAQIELMMSENPSYLRARRLDDGSVAVLASLMYTMAICLGVSENSSFTTRRFCYDDFALVGPVFDSLKSDLDIPDGWVASRGLPL